MCGFRNADCLYCGKRGHTSKVFRTRLKRGPGKNQPGAGGGKFQTAHQLQTDEDTGVPETEALAYTLYAVTTSDKSTPINATVLVNKAELCLEVDTGASSSLISETTHSELQKLTQLPAVSLYNQTEDILWRGVGGPRADDSQRGLPNPATLPIAGGRPRQWPQLAWQ